jgi:hypothetical protein
MMRNSGWWVVAGLADGGGRAPLEEAGPDAGGPACDDAAEAGASLWAGSGFITSRLRKVVRGVGRSLGPATAPHCDNATAELEAQPPGPLGPARPAVGAAGEGAVRSCEAAGGGSPCHTGTWNPRNHPPAIPEAGCAAAPRHRLGRGGQAASAWAPGPAHAAAAPPSGRSEAFSGCSQCGGAQAASTAAAAARTAGMAGPARAASMWARSGPRPRGPT